MRSAGGESQKMSIFNQARCHQKFKRQSLSRLCIAEKSSATQHTKIKSAEIRWQSQTIIMTNGPKFLIWLTKCIPQEVQNRFVSKSMCPRTKCINLVLNLTIYDSCSALMRFIGIISEANENPRIISSNPTHLKQKSSHHRMRKVLQLEKKLVYSTNQQVLPCRNMSWYR